MRASEGGGAGAPSVAERLFCEYVDARAAGEPLDTAELYARAGEHAAELRRLIASSDRVRTLADALGGGTSPPARLGRFEIVREIGAGGLSRVYEAYDRQLGQVRALKVLDHRGRLTEVERARMLNEARSLARLEHPGVVRVFDAAELDGRPCIVMEHVRGHTLAQVLEGLRDARRGGDGRPPGDPVLARHVRRLRSLEARVALFGEVAEAVAACHFQGVIHRDLKPDNVLLEADGTARVIDFGLAHVEDAFDDAASDITQAFFGTQGYLAPEQVEAQRTGANPYSDQFVLGIILYELLTLEHPFREGGFTQRMHSIARSDYEPPRRGHPAVPRELELVCRHALERRPHDRYPSVAELAEDVRAHLEHRPISLRPPSAPRRALLWARRHRALTAGAALLLASVLATSGAQGYVAARARRDAVLARLEGTSLEELSSQGRFAEHGAELVLATELAREFDRSFLRRAAFGSLAERARARGRAYSERLRRVLDARVAEAERQGSDVRWGRWREALVYDAQLCGETSVNREHFTRGQVLLPEGVDASDCELLAYVLEQGTYSVLRPVEYGPRLEPGLYRLRVRGPGELPWSVQEFEVGGEWPPRRVLERITLDGGMAARMVRVERFDHRLDLGPPPGAAWAPERTPPPVELEAGPLLLLSDVVLLGDLIPFANLVPDRLASTGELHARPGAPAVVTAELAHEVATFYGARLPTTLELHGALEQGAIERPSAPVLGEWTAGPVSRELGMRSILDHAERDARPELPYVAWEQVHPKDFEVAGVGFRLAFDLPSSP